MTVIFNENKKYYFITLTDNKNNSISECNIYSKEYYFIENTKEDIGILSVYLFCGKSNSEKKLIKTF